MKKILFLMLALIFTFFSVNAQNLVTSTGQLDPIPVTVVPFEVNLQYQSNLTGTIDSSVATIDGMGYFNDTVVLSDPNGIVTLTYMDCNGNLITLTGVYGPTAISPLSHHDFGIINYCSGSSPNTSTVEAQFTNTSGPIYVELSYDGGITYQSVSTDASGYLYDTINSLTASGIVNAFYYNCNNDTFYLTASNISGSPNSEFYNFGTIDYCPGTSSSTLIQISGQFVDLINPVLGAISFTISGINTPVSGITDTSGMFFMDSIAVSSMPSEIYITYTDCNGTIAMDTAYPSIILPFPTPFDFGNINYCQSAILPMVCIAGFSLDQNIIFDSTGNIISTGVIMLTNTSTSDWPFTDYTWDFGDGSPTYTGVNFIHTYANAGPYVLCLTLSNSIGSCSSTYCDSLSVDSNGLLVGKTNSGFSIQMGDGSFESIGPNAINTLDNKIALNIFPNPAQDFISISLNTEENLRGQIEIYDLTGKLVQMNDLNISAGESKVNIQLENVNKGLYLIKVNTAVGFVTRKIFIK